MQQERDEESQVLTRRGKVAIGVVVALVLLFALGIRVTHPQSGVEHALGSAESSIAVYRVTDNYSLDDKVVVALPENGPALGIVRGVVDGSLDVQIGGTLFRLALDDVNGKMVVIVPFLGYPLSWVGL